MNVRIVSLLAALFLWVFAGALAAQDADYDYSRWSVVADRAEKAVDEDTADDGTFEVLRERLVKFRGELEQARGANAERIESLRSQIEALGPKPEGDNADAEPPDVAAERAKLEGQLADLLAPVQVAEAAYQRANSLIGQIDSVLRERQAKALFAVSASPANPKHWGPALTDLRAAFGALIIPASADTREERRAELLRSLPMTLLSLGLGLLLIIRGRLWATRIINGLEKRGRGPRYYPVWRFLLSLLRIVLPLIGLALLSFAAMNTGYFGERGAQLSAMVTVLGAFIFGFRWVSERVFARNEDEALLKLSEHARARARFWINAITLTLAIEGVLAFVLGLDRAPERTLTVVTFPFTVIMGFALFNLGRILRGYHAQVVDPVDGETPRESTVGRAVRVFGLAAMIVAVIGPLLQLAGYLNAHDALMSPFILTLVLLGLVMALQRFAADVYGAVTGVGVQARDSLLAILTGMVLTMLSLPVLALTWGVRSTDLLEIWADFKRGITIGETTISPTNFLTFAVIFSIGYFVTRLLQGTLRTNVLPKTRMDVGGQNAVVSGLGYIGVFLSALLAITGAGIDLSSLAIVVGALSVGIGFGLQNIVSNFVSGIILLIERPISEGDWIQVGDQMGYVRDISVRSTRIETFDRTDVIVPNADLVSGTVTNYTRGNTVGRIIVPVGVAYGTDTRMVEGILREIAQAHPMVLAKPAPFILFSGFGADALEFEVRCYLRDVNFSLSVRSEINHQINEKFVEAGIEIPFAQRDLWLRNPEALAAKAPLDSTPLDEAEATGGQGDELS